MTIVFWVSAFLIAYVYAGYPALLAIWARLRPRPIRPAPGAQTPAVSIVVAARNESAHLPARIDNLLALEYDGVRQIVVVSDGSADETRRVLAPYRDRIDLVEVPAGGKPRALNAGVAVARHEIIVFADARQTFAPNALTALVAPFGDPEVGAATGELVLDCEHGASASSIAEGVGLYWRYEKWLRRRESEIWSTLGATGAIYAMRRSLWRPLPDDTLVDDLLAPLRVVLDRRRVVCAPAARAFDRTAPDGRAESERKIRTVAGNYQILRHEPRLLLPIVNPVWLQYVSHKLGARLLVPYALIALYASSIALADRAAIYTAAAAAQTVFYALAIYGAWLETHRPVRALDLARGGTR
jgi:cellulose synthase/poly-beta-1,6-N-acetylglucosamine synthase-like glycosyltransferase